MAAWTIRERKKQQRGQVFLILNFDVYINVDNRESTNARMKKKKKKGRPISLEETSLFTPAFYFLLIVRQACVRKIKTAGN